MRCHNHSSNNEQTHMKCLQAGNGKQSINLEGTYVGIDKHVRVMHF